MLTWVNERYGSAGFFFYVFNIITSPSNEVCHCVPWNLNMYQYFDIFFIIYSKEILWNENETNFKTCGRNFIC